MHQGYRTGRGRVVMRSHTHFEELRKGRQALVVDDIPYQVNKKVLVESIARLMHDKKIEGISELRDESSKNVRIVMELKPGAFGEVVLNNLYKLTSMQSSFGINMVALVNGQPRVLNLRDIIEHFLRHRREVVVRRTIYRLNKNRARGHILEGQAVALSNIDEFLAIIRNAPNPPVARAQLMARGWRSSLVSELITRSGGRPEDFRPIDAEAGCGLDAEGYYHLSSIQAEKILQMALQKLTGLEQDKINNEYRECTKEIADLLDILARPERVAAIMDAELEELKIKYGDARRSEIDYSGDPNFNPLDFVPNESVAVTLSDAGYIKRQSLSEYRSQRRGGTGKKAAQMKEGDVISQLFVANTHDTVLCFSNLGQVYTLPVYAIPEGTRTAKGKAIVNLIQLAENESINVILPVSEFAEDHFVFMATEQGVVKKTPLSQFAVNRRSGKCAIELADGDTLIGVAITDGTCDIMLFSDAGKTTRFPETDVRPMGRTARGVAGMRLMGAKLISMCVAGDETQLVLTACENGYGKCTPITEYPRHGRNLQGTIGIRTTERNGRVVAATLVHPQDTVMLLTSLGKLVRTRVANISVVGRATQGVTLIDVRGDKLVSVTRVAADDVDEPQTEEEGREAPAPNQAPEAPAGEGRAPQQSAQLSLLMEPDDESGR